MESVNVDAGAMFAALRDADGYHLSVVVGGIAMYEVRRTMEDEAVAQFLEDPARLIRWVEKIRREMP